MKKIILVGIFMFFVQILSAQTDTAAVFSKKNTVYLGLDMSGLLHYDRIVWQKGKHKLGFGLGAWAWERNSSGYLRNERLAGFIGSASFNYLYGNNKRMLEVNLSYVGAYNEFRQGSFAYGRYESNGSYIGGASDFANSSELKQLWKDKTVFVIDSTYLYKQKNHSLMTRIGYRRQNPKGGFFFKTGVTFMGMYLDNNTGFPDISPLSTDKSRGRRFGVFFYPDISVGWSF